MKKLILGLAATAAIAAPVAIAVRPTPPHGQEFVVDGCFQRRRLPPTPA